MAGIDFKASKYTMPIEDFNRRYGVNFNIESYELQAKGLAQLNPQRAFDDAFKITFVNLYKKAMGNFVDHKIDGLEANVMLKSFHDIMEVYRADCKKKGIVTDLHALGGWKPKEAYETLKASVEALPKNKIEYAKARYLNGDLRIRDMVAHTQKTLGDNQNNFNTEKLSVLIAYSKALKEVNANRSFMWKMFHPVRNNAEQREAARIEEMVKEKAKMVVYDAAENRAMQDEYRIAYAKDSLNYDIERQKQLEESRRTEVKEKLNVAEAAMTESKEKTSEKVQEIQAPVKEEMKLQ